jgi:hypothetical protein
MMSVIQYHIVAHACVLSRNVGHVETSTPSGRFKYPMLTSLFLGSDGNGFTLRCGCFEQSHGNLPLYPPVVEVLCLSCAPVVNGDGQIGGNLRVNANLQSGEKHN